MGIDFPGLPGSAGGQDARLVVRRVDHRVQRMQDVALLDHLNSTEGVAGKVVEDLGAPLNGLFCGHIAGDELTGR